MATKLCDLQYTLCMIAGASLQRGFRFKDSDGDLIDLSGYHAAIHIRDKAGAAEDVISLDSDEATEAGSTLVIDGAGGTITMDIVPDETLEFTDISKDKKLVWDLRVTDGDDNVNVYFRVSPFIIKPVSTREEPEAVEEP